MRLSRTMATFSAWIELRETLELLIALVFLSCAANWDDSSGPAPLHDQYTDHPMFRQLPKDGGTE